MNFKIKIKMFFCIACLAVILAHFSPLFQARQEIVVLDVPGSSVIFSEDRTGKKILFNGGKGEVSSQDYWTVIPFLKSRGIKKLDAVFVTSLRKKYWGGLMRIADHSSIETLVVPWPHLREPNFRSLLGKIRKKGGSLSGLVPGDKYFFSEISQVDVLSLYPERPGSKASVLEGLDASALCLKHGNIRMLLLDENFDLNSWDSLRNQKADIVYLNGKRFLETDCIRQLRALAPQALILANVPPSEDRPLRQAIQNWNGTLFNLKETGALILREQGGGFTIRPHIRPL
ncbi:MAG: hypothetical protein HY586_05035 [Candidatus Omnitrophica bacterium]|nr:hypothetical protein [Candidatus Omnitrophota bacterium]